METMLRPRHLNAAIPLAALGLLIAVVAWAADWPMWRCDPGRTGATAEELPPALHLQWSVEMPKLEPAWPDEERMGFDLAYEPVVMDDLVFIGSPAEDTLTARDAADGTVRWRFFADGPVRFAPACWEGKVYFGSDDGFVYCLDAQTGKLLWQFSAAPRQRLCLGNKRLTSTWPVRGAPVISQGKLYFAAGIWPFMGVFVYCLDAETGRELWINDGTSAVFMLQPHNSPAFAAIAPQGYMVVNGDRLIVPGGRSVPACFDANTGEMLYYHLAPFNRLGTYSACSLGARLFNSGNMWDLATGQYSGTIGTDPVLTPEMVYSLTDASVTAVRSDTIKQAEATDDKGNVARTLAGDRLWRSDVKADRLWLKAGSRLYASRGNHLMALKSEDADDDTIPLWEADIEGTPGAMAAAEGRLYVSTLEGKLQCFGGQELEPRTYPLSPTAGASTDQDQRAEAILAKTPAPEGYCLVLGARDGGLAEALARKTSMHVIAIGKDPERVAVIRERLQAAGLYGTRIAALAGDPSELQLPAYFATLVVAEDPSELAAGDGALWRTVQQALRPYGGQAVFELPAEQRGLQVADAVDDELAGVDVAREGDLLTIRRPGALPDAGTWVGQYGSMTNACVSQDQLVRAPLGLLWYGGSSNATILPRHGHGPPEQVIGGRLFIEGPDSLRAVDVYTGRVLWEVPLPGIGDAYNNTSHEPGANAVGTNFFATVDRVYVANGRRCTCLDPASGAQVGEILLPAAPGEAEPQVWGYIGVTGETLIAGASPLVFQGEAKIGKQNNWDGTASRRIVVFDRHSGAVLWQCEARYSFRHNAIAAGAGRLYLIDSLPDVAVQKLQRRGEEATFQPRMLALDLATGSVVWESTQNVFGTWLSYSEKHGLLLQAGRPSRDMLPNEPGDRIIAHQAATGEVVWDKAHKYFGPVLLHGDRIITQAIDMKNPGMALDIRTGERLSMASPLTGESMPWEYGRNYGCNTVVASPNLITFRSAAAGYFDLSTGGGTGNLGGFKSGCTSNLVVADGVLNAPEYTRTCTCSYQNRTSLALIHSPDVETWTFTMLSRGKEPIRALGINLGAPGDRVDDDGVLWLEYPIVGGPSPEVKVSASPEGVGYFRHHSSRYEGDGPRWVAASGAEGLQQIDIDLAEAGAPLRTYEVCLYFAEPEAAAQGQRVFDVQLQGRAVETGLDVIGLTGKPRTVLVRTYGGVEVTDRLSIRLQPAAGSSRPPLLCGLRCVAK